MFAWVMFSGGAHWRWGSLSTSEERPGGRSSVTRVAKRWCRWRDERQKYRPAVWRIAFGPSPNGVPHSWARSSHSSGLHKPNPSNWVPPGPKGNSVSREQALHRAGTSHSPCWCPGTGTIPGVTLQLLTATQLFTGRLWTLHVQRASVLQGRGPQLPESVLPVPGQATQMLQDKGERRNHTFSPANYSPS